ncbi:MAG TPA: protein kinase [Nannocystaceae bacterium]|nr:protein kinase [Nannocystaceae bacterium]
MGSLDATPRRQGDVVPMGDRTPRVRAPDGDEIVRGTPIGRYIVLGKLGEGGMGTVASAFDPELDRKVALKLVRGDGDAEGAARLLREARALARLRHPNVVAVHDVGEYERGVWIAMELVDGVTLREWMSSRPAWRDVLRVFCAAGQGLAAAHAAGLVHRDFKPSNVILGQDGRVRVVDFGLARTSRSLASESESAPIGSPSTVDVVVTIAAMVGTPAYMAPEQHLGQPIDARADQWAFCVALHEALWGVRPFVGNDEAQLRRAVLAGEIVATAEAGVPAAVRRAVLRGLSYEPGARHRDLPELIAELERARRRRGRQLFALAGALVLGGALGATAWALGDRTREASAWVERAGQDARAAAAKAWFVYPPPSDPEYATALVQVLALEKSGDDEARAAAAALREEFAATLARLGDRYWEREGGRPFAIDYYTQALVFDPEHAHARERAVVTAGELVALRQRADERTFSPAELDAAEVLAILADPDEPARDRALAVSSPKRGLATRAAIDELLAAKREAKPRERDQPNAPKTVAPIAVPPPAKPTTAAPEAARASDKAGATQLVADGKAAQKRGDTKAAESAFHRALAADAKNVAALAALGDLHFDRGAYPKAVDFTARAVALAPKRADLRIALGDAYFKVLRYADARAQYQRAKDLGHKSAAARIAQVDAKLGK